MNRATTRAAFIILGVCASVYGGVACGDDDNSSTPTPTPDAGGSDAAPVDAGGGTDAAAADAGLVPVTIKFKAKVGDQDFHCNTVYPNQGSANTSVEPRDLRFFVQDLKMLDSSGKATPVTLDVRSPWQTADVALLDFEDGTGACFNGNADLNAEVTGKVPAGTYTGIAFTNGVPVTINHADPATAPAPLTADGMTWGWLLGHLFIKAEMTAANDAGGVGLLHLGSVGCDNSVDGGAPDYTAAPIIPCSQPNRNEIRLTTFAPATNFVVLDVKTIFASTDLSTSNQCHSGGEACPPLFSSVGLDFDGGARLTTHPAFRVE